MTPAAAATFYERAVPRGCGRAGSDCAGRRRSGRRAAGREVLAADEQVDQAVVVVVAPGGRLGRDRLGQPAGDRHVIEGAVSPVPQQRKPQRLLPAAAQQQHVQVAVVVEVGAGTFKA